VIIGNRSQFEFLHITSYLSQKVDRQSTIMKLLQTLLSFYFLVSTLFFASVSCWSTQHVPTRFFRSVANNNKQTSEQGKPLFYRNGTEDHDLQAVVISKTAVSLQAPNPLELPKHSLPREVVRRKKLVWDMEMMFGRVAMVAFVFMVAGELLTGLSATDQMTGISFLF
jgi:hypothetical protein